MTDTPPTLGLRRIIVALIDGEVDFVVCGGVACILQGVVRSTADLDCCVRMEQQNLERFVRAVADLGFRLRVPEPIDALLDPQRRRAWVVEKQARVITLVADDATAQVDMFLEYPVPYDELAARADPATTLGRTFRVSSKADLLLAKRAVDPPREIDRRDIVDLMARLREEGIDASGA